MGVRGPVLGVEAVDQLARLLALAEVVEVPHLDGVIGPAAGEELAVGAEGQAGNRIVMSPFVGGDLRGGCVGSARSHR